MKENIRIKLRNGFFAGFVSICFNTLLLKISPLLSIKAEGGGLLKLILSTGRGSPGQYSFLKSSGFALLFHFLTGFIMAYLYVFLIEPITGLTGLLKGSLFSLVPWLINGFFVLPLLGFGPLGIKMLSATGIVFFFITIGCLAYCLERCMSNSTDEAIDNFCLSLMCFYDENHRFFN